ncbi:hypothetical protein [Corynebacterium sp. A21]|uniref:hypothetical protein n=1 Tax=Corynebacterium sp. A21 TaxID=3457318 RepID=UPI003FD46265
MSAVVIYGDISPNVVDGSSIWLMSITETLAGVFDEVHLQLKMRPENDRLVGGLKKIRNVELHNPSTDTALTHEQAKFEIADLVQSTNATAVVARGMDICNELCRSSIVGPKLWAYITDLPFPPEKISDKNKVRLGRIAHHSRRLFAQTEAARSYLEAIAPQAAGKAVLMRPMIPTSAFDEGSVERGRKPGDVLKLVYSGKFAKDWKTLEMLELPAELRKIGVPAELHVVGDKFNRDRTDPHWIERMKAALEAAHADPESGITWFGGVSRSESIRLLSEAHIGIGWRNPILDASLEISTKALEYSAAGTIPVVNLNGDNIDFFGEEYPFFIRGTSSTAEAAKIIADGLPFMDALRPRIRNAARTYSMDAAKQRFRTYFERAGAVPCKRAEVQDRNSTRVVIAAHDFKFMGELMDKLNQHPNYDVQLDRWESLHQHDESESQRLAQWADVVFCEWAGPSLAWYSNNLPTEKKLVSRLHGFELRGAWLPNIDFTNVDIMVFVSDFYRQRAESQLPIDALETMVIPNSIDLVDFDRPKLAGAQFNLGMAGMVPFLKRPDRAVNLLESLLEVDDRYSLFIRGRAPWEYPYEWKDPVQKQLYLELFARVTEDPVLKERVVFEPFGADMASWLRNIGIILSPSDSESFHLAPAEGMASRCVPVVWSREGSLEIFGENNVYPSLQFAVERILEMRDHEMFLRLGTDSRDFVGKWDIDTTFVKWQKALEIS